MNFLPVILTKIECVLVSFIFFGMYINFISKNSKILSFSFKILIVRKTVIHGGFVTVGGDCVRKWVQYFQVIQVIKCSSVIYKLKVFNLWFKIFLNCLWFSRYFVFVLQIWGVCCCKVDSFFYNAEWVDLKTFVECSLNFLVDLKFFWWLDASA